MILDQCPDSEVLSISQQIQADIQATLGFIPPFFRPAFQNPPILESLWRQTCSLYLENPLPDIFKEKLSAYLSRFCAIPYCLICHSCSLYALGIEAHRILELLASPLPTATTVEQYLQTLAHYPAELGIPTDASPDLEASLLGCSIQVALQSDQAEPCRAALRRVLGVKFYQYLLSFIAYVKACHSWVEAHVEEIAYQDDLRVQTYFCNLIEADPALADFFINYWERVKQERLTWSEQQAELAERQRNQVALQKLAEENLYLARAIASTSEGVLITDPGQPDNPIIYANRAFLRMTGYEAREVIGRNCRFLQGVETDPATIAQLKQAIREQREVTITLLNYRKDGTPFWNELRIAPVFSESGDLLYFVGIQSDISARRGAEESLKQSESTLRSFFNSASMMMGIVELVGDDIRHISDNAATAQFFGQSPATMKNRLATELGVPEAYRQLWLTHYREAEQSQQPVRFEYSHETEQGVIWLSATVSAIDHHGEQTSRFAYIIEDITEKKRLESQFLRAQRMESIGTLASGIAHDLNNVLTPILTSTQLMLMKSDPDSKQQQLLETIQNSARRGAALIKQVLSFARGVEGKRITLQVQHLITEIRQIAQETFPKSIEMKLDLPTNLWLVSGDATQLHQVLMNLCVNARDAMPNGGTLSLSAKNLHIDPPYTRMNLDAKVGAYIVISVTDTGAGISPEILDRIFEPFFTTKDFGKGTGLGLSTVLGIIKSHGGFIEVNSALNQGTQFNLYLPAIQGMETAATPESEAIEGQGELILVVDDEAKIRQVDQAALEAYNYQVITASDGIEAIALYAQHKQEIQLVVMDLMMPSMDGAMAIRTLRKINPQIKTVVTSGLVTDPVTLTQIGSPLQTFLAKPYTAKELVSTISRALNQP